MIRFNVLERTTGKITKFAQPTNEGTRNVVTGILCKHLGLKA